MRFTFAVLAMTAAFTTSLQARPALPHLDLEMEGAEYRPLVDKIADLEDAASPELRRILEIGARNLDWLALINSQRDAAGRLELSTPGTQRGIPIESPSTSNESIILGNYNAWVAGTDAGITQVLLGRGPMPTNPPVADDVYLGAARQIDRIYQNASRWILQLPYLEEYAAYKKYDVRGYYHLARETDLDAKLAGWATLAQTERDRLRPLLIGQCFNVEANSLRTCEAEFAAAERAGTLAAFFASYADDALALWNSYFDIPVSRTDVAWTGADAATMRIPFRDPGNSEVLDWLRDNIEDEFRWNGWQLRLDFVTTTDEYTTHIDFVPGTTPHVNELAGSIITMDANRSLQEYSSRWTIRHEYGHVLGLPDCYVEFFDEAAGVMVNYQLDIDNLMCSRRGRFQQRHFDELSRVYFVGP